MKVFKVKNKKTSQKSLKSKRYFCFDADRHGRCDLNLDLANSVRFDECLGFGKVIAYRYIGATRFVWVMVRVK